MSDTGERGPVGERGPKGDHGQDGVKGKKGEVGPAGPEGEVPFVLRHLTEAFVFLLLGIIAGFGFSEFRSRDALTQATSRIDFEVSELCKAGNLRSDLEKQQLAEQRARTATFNFQAIVNLPEPDRTRVAEELKQQSLDASDRNIARVPYIDCETGKRIPAPPLPTTTTIPTTTTTISE